MSRIFDEIREEAAHECSVEIAERMLEAGELTYEEISRYAMIPLDEVKALAEKSTAKPS